MFSTLIYSSILPLNRGGLGTISWHGCRALSEAGMLHRVFAPEVGAAESLEGQAIGFDWPLQKVWAAMNRFGCHNLKDAFLDRWVASWIQSEVNYYGWLHASLVCIRKIHHYGGKTFVDRGSVEPRLQQKWLAEEYQRFGLRSEPVSEAAIQRMITEADETDFIVVPSNLVAQSYVSAGYPASKLRVNPLGVDLRLFTPQERRSKSGPLQFLFVGQLSVQKGVPDLLQSWGQVNPKNAELVLAGVIPFQETSVIQPLLNQAPNVVWKGHSQDVASLMRMADVLILPSAQDGFGLVVLEALASGLPVIISDRVGAQDCLTPGKEGFVFPFGSRDHLSDCLHSFLSSPERIVQMGAQARKTAECFSWESYGQRLVSCIRNS